MKTGDISSIKEYDNGNHSWKDDNASGVDRCQISAGSGGRFRLAKKDIYIKRMGNWTTECTNVCYHLQLETPEGTPSSRR